MTYEAPATHRLGGLSPGRAHLRAAPGDGEGTRLQSARQAGRLSMLLLGVVAQATPAALQPAGTPGARGANRGVERC